MLRNFRRPTIMIIRNEGDFSLADRFSSEFNLFAECGIVDVLNWYISDRNVTKTENQRMLGNRLESANAVLLLATHKLISSTYYRQVLIPQLREFRNIESKSLFSIILSPLNEEELGIIGELQSRESLIFPSDRKSVFGEHLPEEMEGVFAEIIENIFLALINKFFRPPGVHVGQKDKVFISYSRTDYKIANIARAFLSGQGIDVWMDKYNIKGGQNWVRAVDDGIRDSWALILLLSHTSKVSEYVNYEWSFAFGANTCVIPIMIENVSLHPRLAWINCLNWYHLNVPQYTWDDLIDALSIAKSNASKGTCNT